MRKQNKTNKEDSRLKRSKSKANEMDPEKLAEMLKELASISADLLQEEPPSLAPSLDNKDNSTSGEL